MGLDHHAAAVCDHLAGGCNVARSDARPQAAHHLGAAATGDKIQPTRPPCTEMSPWEATEGMNPSLRMSSSPGNWRHSPLQKLIPGTASAKNVKQPPQTSSPPQPALPEGNRTGRQAMSRSSEQVDLFSSILQPALSDRDQSQGVVARPLFRVVLHLLKHLLHDATPDLFMQASHTTRTPLLSCTPWGNPSNRLQMSTLDKSRSC